MDTGATDAFEASDVAAEVTGVLSMVEVVKDFCEVEAL